MPTLDWIGKAAVRNHHLEVPFHLLRADAALSCGAPAAGNLLIEGDNLLALKALLPYYAGQVKCIYIDPPYNTGNEQWVYNDNVNSPEMRTWLGRVVGGEAEDLSRHDKWLCMMYPRLTLLRQMLREDGVILISIDDNEAHSLRMLLDEIYGRSNFVGTIVWRNVTDNNPTRISIEHEYVLCYARDKAKLESQWKATALPIKDLNTGHFNK
ncbi:MAG TPA: site-specific DNA-methyltransferase [Anaerolineaceae bacterium]|nr:site-specific DNA-methyltransferase [Anaerolineaceae bacterium]